MRELTYLIKRHPVFSYCALTLTWSFFWWGLILSVVPIGLLMKPPLNPMAILYMVIGAISPSISGFVLTRIVCSKGANWALLRRLGLWRNGWMWLAVLIPWTVTSVPSILYGVSTGEFPTDAMLSALPVGIFLGVYAGLFEEFGWRGFLQPQLQKRYSPFHSALLVGLVWGGLWHLFVDWIAIGDDGFRSLTLVVLQAPLLLIAHAVLLAWVYNRTGGSMLLCVLFHFGISSSAFAFGVTYPSYETQLAWTTITVALWCAIALAVVLLDRRVMLVAPLAPESPAIPTTSDLRASAG